MRKIISILLTVMLLAPFLFLVKNTYAQEKALQTEVLQALFLGDAPLTAEQERKVAICLYEGTKAYLAKLRQVNFLSFRGRKEIDAETAVSLKAEVDITVTCLENMLRSLEKQKESADMYSVLTWIFVVRNISINIEEMNDFSRFGLVDSDWYRMLTLVLPGIFDKVIIPKVLDLTWNRQPRKNSK
jgi:hypothetical protein